MALLYHLFFLLVISLELSDLSIILSLNYPKVENCHEVFTERLTFDFSVNSEWGNDNLGVVSVSVCASVTYKLSTQLCPMPIFFNNSQLTPSSMLSSKNLREKLYLNSLSHAFRIVSVNYYSLPYAGFYMMATSTLVWSIVARL